MKTRKLTAKERLAARTRRRAHIRRGMKIATYEINLILAQLGMHVILPREYVEHVIALAEGGRQDATMLDKLEKAVSMIRFGEL